ncbi:cytochrome C [Permianibacter sp. IMCC34836]|uniref:cytochrome C n=1 Tax=Permianibacter fluminis TaxID=2738515 RepID=UPI0015572EB4|nr:cytochrome C [Permianibacter fluminis]NQD37265.1 cytochrome C [Permianibacter fluminis]
MRAVPLAIVPLLMLLLLTMVKAASAADSLETALMPGPVIAGHAKLEADCAQCHVKFNKNAQDGQCLGCHKPVAADFKQKTGFHGRLPAQPCRACHLEHRGRDADMVKFDQAGFDHKQTDFLLRGAHQSPPLRCQQCHQSEHAFREAPNRCEGCHRADDHHKAALGSDCQRCHAEDKWPNGKFDHSQTRFALDGKHLTAKCESCHKAGASPALPQTCVACHRTDDAHKGKFGDDCASCHQASDWKKTRFDHGAVSGFALTGKHASASCKSCHTGAITDPLPNTCVSCHKSDDVHQGKLGTQCQSCHRADAWKGLPFDHSKTDFALTGAHSKASCKQCHASQLFADTQTACASCHQKNDVHKGRFGSQCQSCHDSSNWKPRGFDHGKLTGYALLGKHQPLRCEQCHSKTLTEPKLDRRCVSCHQQTDPHKGKLGANCDSCHSESSWQQTRFNHQLTGFPLLGQHLALSCKKCHSDALFKGTSTQCSSCHGKTDKHKGALGSRCEQCHNARDWRLADFNHDKQTRFALTGKHRQLACEQCHVRAGQPASSCGSCHQSDDRHDGRFGSDCGRCHRSENWQQVIKTSANEKVSLEHLKDEDIVMWIMNRKLAASN